MRSQQGALCMQKRGGELHAPHSVVAPLVVQVARNAVRIKGDDLQGGIAICGCHNLFWVSQFILHA